MVLDMNESQHDISKPLRLLEAIASGKTVTRDEIANVDWIAPKRTDKLLRDTVLKMLQWASDEDIMARDQEYADLKLAQLRRRLAEIRALAMREGLSI